MTYMDDEIERVRTLINKREEFAGDGVRGFWRYKNNATMYTVQYEGGIVFAWAQSAGRWYETRQLFYEESHSRSVFQRRNRIRPDEGTTLIDYSVMQDLFHDPSTPPEIAGLLKVSP